MLVDILWAIVPAIILIPAEAVLIIAVHYIMFPFYTTQWICTLTGTDLLMPEDTEKARLEPGLKRRAKDLMYNPDKLLGFLSGNKNKNRYMDDHKFMAGNAVRFGNMTLRHYYDGDILPKKLENMAGQQACMQVMLTPTDKIETDLGPEAKKTIGTNDLLHIIAQAKPDIANNFLLTYMRHRGDLEDEVERFIMLPETDELKIVDKSKQKNVDKATDKLISEIKQVCIYCSTLPIQGRVPVALGLMMAACPDDELSDQMVSKIEMEKKEEAKATAGNPLLLVAGIAVGEAMLFVGALIVVIILMNG